MNQEYERYIGYIHAPHPKGGKESGTCFFVNANTAIAASHNEYKEKNSKHKSTRRVIMFYDIIGGIFDFNGDGHTDFAEEAVGFAIMEDMMSEDGSEDDFDTDADDW
jgi:hypothetical protein